MNPTQPTPSAVPERPLAPTPEAVPGVSPATPEHSAPVETAPQPSQAPSAPPPAAAVSPVIAPTDSPAVVPAAPLTPPVVPTVPGPAIADDVDVIEKEWVDHANAVIEATKDNPYKEEEAIEDLQVDYLKKRYGKDIKKDAPKADEPQT